MRRYFNILLLLLFAIPKDYMSRIKVPREESEAQQALMHATIELLGTKGFDAVTARAVSEKAKVSQALVFYHFDSVTNLIIQSASQMSSSRFDVYKKIIETTDDTNELLEKLFEAFEKDNNSGSYFAMNQFLSAARRDKVVAKHVEEIFGKWIELAKLSIKKIVGEIDPPGNLSTDDLALMALSFLLSLQMLNPVKKYKTQIDQIMVGLKDMTPMLATFAAMFNSH